MRLYQDIYLGQQRIQEKKHIIKEQFKKNDDDLYYEIENYKKMPPFFMTITSNTNHWMFVSSTGGLTTGRVNSESALFPYYTDDRITENHVNTGPKTVFLITENGRTSLWEPFSDEINQVYEIHSRLSKNISGNIISFEETNETLGISFTYRWMNSRKYGWIRHASVRNLNINDVQIEVIDGLQNILPAGTSSQIQNTFGNLLDAYKNSEIDKESGMGIFALSATLTDLAEPSESLKANIVWQLGLNADHYLLSNQQLEDFSRGKEINGEWENKGGRGCFFVHSSFSLTDGENKEWYIAADVDRDHSQVNNLKKSLENNKRDLIQSLLDDVQKGHKELERILSQNDGIQKTSTEMNCVHHRANVLFNIMRGGYFFNSYLISIADLNDFISVTNKGAGKKYSEKLITLGENAHYNDVLTFVLEQNDVTLERIWYEYLPLTFSRRHGDPSRPWNLFSIETEKIDGSAKLDYQGNWRDIFQNWEALCFSYPLYLKHVIQKFLNATTKDGYNPYRITKNGIDWEIPEPGNPWANIGYWSDHQIIYLLKLLEVYKKFNGSSLADEMDRSIYSFANVPYEIKSFKDIVRDPHQTITFNRDRNKRIEELTGRNGSDGKLLYDSKGNVFLATMTEKLFILLLTKLGNFIPGGGIWMNTQRPEWNDANNALVGKGISVVTLAYLRRYISFLTDLIEGASLTSFTFHTDTAQWFLSIASVFSSYEKELDHSLTAEERYLVVESLGMASEKYRNKLYRDEIDSGETKISSEKLLHFLKNTLKCVDHSLRSNKRDDGLYHSYNTLELGDKSLIIHNLYEMLEGQVAVLSSGMLTAEEVDQTLIALRKSSMYREDQNSYMLYPNRILPGFLDKNNIDEKEVLSSELLTELLKNNNSDLISRDYLGKYHFHGNFHNVKQVRDVLQDLSFNSAYTSLIQKEGKKIETLFDTTFDHQSFTGRSGTFFAFEGLGSIYWHMVSKLLLTVQENLFEAIRKNEKPELISSLKEHYYSVRRGIGYNKSAEAYGAFPFDPYSHTPFGKGAKQPGMTGQVKEEVITRLAETGIRISDGKLTFDAALLDERELFGKPVTWKVKTISGDDLSIEIPAGALGATFCQTPYIIHKKAESSITVFFADKRKMYISGSVLPEEISLQIFRRTGDILYLDIAL